MAASFITAITSDQYLDNSIYGSMTFSPTEYLHVKPKIKSIYKQNPYPDPNPHIKLILKPYHSLNPNPNPLEKLRPEQMLCHL